jgi:hypothetical protein
LASIAARGIQEPLEGVEVQQRPVLLNGFKRYRCARQLRLATVPYSSPGGDEAAALSRSQAWVSVRLGLLAQMSEGVRRQLFAGAFPVYAYMYVLRPFMRLNGESAQAVEPFVTAVSGKGLSVREIEQLAHGFFRGPESFRAEIRKGNLALPLERMRRTPANPEACSEFERVLLGDLEILQKYMQRVMGKSQEQNKLSSRGFHAQCHLLTAGILSRARAFFHTLRQLHDRNGQA